MDLKWTKKDPKVVWKTNDVMLWVWKNSQKSLRFIAQKRGNFPKKILRVTSRAFTFSKNWFEYNRRIWTQHSRFLWRYNQISRDFVKLSITDHGQPTYTRWLGKKIILLPLFKRIYNQSSIKTRYLSGKLFFFKNAAWGKKGFVS